MVNQNKPAKISMDNTEKIYSKTEVINIINKILYNVAESTDYSFYVNIGNLKDIDISAYYTIDDEAKKIFIQECGTKSVKIPFDSSEKFLKITVDEDYKYYYLNLDTYDVLFQEEMVDKIFENASYKVAITIAIERLYNEYVAKNISNKTKLLEEKKLLDAKLKEINTKLTVVDAKIPKNERKNKK